MNKAFVVLLLVLMSFGWAGCSAEKFGAPTGVGVVFDGAPMIFEPSVVHMGSTVGQILSSQWKNGVTRLTISFDSDGQHLQRSNMAAVVKNGRLNLVELGATGDPLPDSVCLLGFKNNIELKWFKFKNLINNINLAAYQRAQGLTALFGPAA